jgi:hypothetical protein
MKKAVLFSAQTNDTFFSQTTCSEKSSRNWRLREVCRREQFYLGMTIQSWKPIQVSNARS